MNNLLNTMSVTHFLNFMILGILFPSNYIGALILGIGWELLAECIAKQEFSKDFFVQHFKDYQLLWQEDKKNKLIELTICMLGYYMGNRIRGISPL